MMVAISASLAPTSESRVTAVPRRSLKVTPVTPTDVQAFRQDDRKPSADQVFPSELRRIAAPRHPRTGFAPTRASGRYHRARVLIPASDPWTHANGLEPKVGREGEA